ncbi:MAG: alpha/beta hydrolase, partial [Pseudomonadota bacterium]|nr:alpha/beta hydrolase [Pseudomonadota bacterium]
MVPPLFDGFEQRLVPVGVDIHARIGGAGPPVLLLHGFPQNLFMWARVAPLLAEHFTVVCADLRGYGGSAKPPADADLNNYSFRAMAEDQLELMHALGFERFHVVGHDRGARTGHRMALDHPQAVQSLAVLDIVPTHMMFAQVDCELARAYWHWYFLQQPAPYPENVIAANPDNFYEGCLIGWGATGLEAFDPRQLAEYRRSWRSLEAIYGSCADYRAAAQVDFKLDEADLGRKIECPTLAFWGSAGLMHQLFNMKQVWTERCVKLTCASLPGGHFFVDQYPMDTAAILKSFLS